MGADLYIRSIDNKNRAQFEPLFRKAVTKRDKISGSFEFNIVLNNKLVISPDFDEPYVINDEVAAKCDKCYVEQAKRLMDRVNAAQKEVSKYYGKMYDDNGYFRDSYNGTSVLNALGLSWWKDVIPMLDKEGILTPLRAVDLIARIKAAKFKVITKESLKKDHCTVDDDKNSVFVWKKHFTDKRKRLIKFLQSAIDLNEGVSCSL